MSIAGLHTAARRAVAPAGNRSRPLDFGTALLRRLPPNLAHKAAVKALRYGLGPRRPSRDDQALGMRLWGLDFANPIGMAAGFDKNGEAADGMIGLGFGFAEAGTVTPLPQPGNPQPNLFRLEEDRALINRLGFPSCGLDRFTANLARSHRRQTGVVGVNVGMNSGSPHPVQDVIVGVKAVAPLCDYVVVNVSCPNTPGLSEWQTPERMAEMVGAAMAARGEAAVGGRKPALLVKISPDLDDAHLAAVAEMALRQGIDGLIATNTTTARPSGLHSAHARQTGGLSGPPLFDMATRGLSRLYRLTDGKVPLIGCGGISSGADAYAKIRAGASLIQLYTALIYSGPGLIDEIKSSLLAHLRADGFDRLSQAVGADHR